MMMDAKVAQIFGARPVALVIGLASGVLLGFAADLMRLDLLYLWSVYPFLSPWPR